jgi:arsenate reductase-like glutaredoxin family protein
MTVTIYHKPKCGTSRNTLAVIGSIRSLTYQPG